MNILSFILYCIIVTFSPGPANIVILATTHNSGPRKAIEFSCGAAAAFALLLTASALLNSLLAAALPGILMLLRILGSLYILYLAWKIYGMENHEEATGSAGTFSSGFLMQFVNPKVVLFTMTVIPGFVLPYYNDPLQISGFVILISVIGSCAFVSWILFGVAFKSLLSRYRKGANSIMALFLIYSAFMVSGLTELIRH